MIQIEQPAWEAMREHAERIYPNECCGVMLGSVDEVKVVRETVALDNVAEGSHRARYEIAPDDLLSAGREARERGLDLIGIYHSHPDCDAYFSATDLKNSCPWYSFVVLSVKNGEYHHAHCFLPNAEQTDAPEEPITWLKS